MKRLICALLAAALLAGLSGCGDRASSVQIFAMDTVMDLTAFGRGGDGAVNRAAEEINRLEALLSRTRRDSAVSGLNAAGSAGGMDPEAFALLRMAAEFNRATAGAFDITVAPLADAWGFAGETQRVPSRQELEGLLPLVGGEHLRLSAGAAALDRGTQIDLGGIAKGYASGCVERVFRDCGVKSGVASLGGNVYAHGVKPDGTPWRVGVRDPRSPDEFAAVLLLEDAYAVTSGGYQRYFEQDGRRYHHILDPASGCPADSGLISVTIVAPADGEREDGSYPAHGAMCDAFSTALFVMGEESAVDFWRTDGYDFEMLLVTEDGRILVSEGLAGRLEETEESGYEYAIVPRNG